MSPSIFAKVLSLIGLLTTAALAQDLPPRFLVSGYPLGDARTHLDDSETRTYRHALMAFPNVAACLKDGVDPAIAKLNLAAFSNLQELEVCLFLTADMLRNLEAMRALLARSGFTVHGNIESPKSVMAHFGVVGVGTSISARIATENTPPGLVGWLDRLVMAYALNANVLFSPTLEPIDARTSILRL